MKSRQLSMAGILAGRLALITGAASGIGKSVCEVFSRHGAIVCAVGLNNTDNVINTLPPAQNGDHFAATLDVSNGLQVKEILREVEKRYLRPPCIAVNCAGITKDDLIVKMTEESFDNVINVNLKGTFLVTKYLVTSLIAKKIKPASIINISSIVGKTGNIGQSNYSASKAGVIALTKTTALEYARHGIRCNAVLPGYIETPMTEKVPDKVKQMALKMIPLGEMGQPEDIARACLFLASEQSRYVTGASLEVTGGWAA